MRPLSKNIVLPAVCIALAVALGFALSLIPNVELVTATVFLSGFLLGPAKGLAVGVMAESLFSLLSPYGPAPPPLLAAQAVSMGLTGLAGGMAAKMRMNMKTLFALRLGVAGLLCTLLFDALTTLSFVVINHFTLRQLAASALLGTWFYAVHLAGNAVIFAVLMPVLIRSIQTVFPKGV